MADSQRIIKNLLQYSIDKAKLDEAVKGSERLRDKQREIVTSTKQIDVVSQLAAKRLLEQSRAMSTLDKGTRAATEQYDKLTQSIKRNNDEQGKTPASSGTKQFRTGAALSGAAGLAGNIGGSALAEPIRVVGDLQRVTSAFGEMGPLAGIAGVGLIAVGAAFAKMNSDLEPARKALEGALSGQRAYYDFISGNTTTEDVKKRIEDLKALAADERTIIAENQNAVSGAFRDAQQSYGDLAARLAFAVGDADDKVGESTANAQKNLSAYETEMKRLEQTLANGTLNTADMALKESELAAAREAAVPKLQALAEQALKLQQDAADRTNEINDDRRIRDEREQEDFDRNQQRAQRSLNDNLVKIGLQGADRLAQIREQGNSRIAQIEASLTTLRQNFMTSERERVRKFYEQEKKADSQNKKERLRRIEDLQDSLRDAQEKNDVIAFIAAQRAGEKDLRRMAEDADEQTQERQAQFEEESRLSRERYEAEIAAQEAAKIEVLANIQQQLDAERARIAEAKKLAQEQFAEQQKLQNDEREIRLSRQVEDEKRADDRRKAALDKALADIEAKTQKEAAAIGLIGTSLDNLVKAVQNGTTSAIARIIAAASSSVSSSNRGGGASFTGTSGSGSSFTRRSGGSRPIAFGLGGIADRPTQSLLGERPGYGDVILPYQKSKGPGSALQQYAGGPTFMFSFGDMAPGVTKQDVEIIVKTGIRESYKGFMDARRPD